MIAGEPEATSTGPNKDICGNVGSDSEDDLHSDEAIRGQADGIRYAVFRW